MRLLTHDGDDISSNVTGFFRITSHFETAYRALGAAKANTEAIVLAVTKN